MCPAAAKSSGVCVRNRENTLRGRQQQFNDYNEKASPGPNPTIKKYGSSENLIRKLDGRNS
jgi:hypothetical protein